MNSLECLIDVVLTICAGPVCSAFFAGNCKEGVDCRFAHEIDFDKNTYGDISPNHPPINSSPRILSSEENSIRRKKDGSTRPASLTISLPVTRENSEVPHFASDSRSLEESSRGKPSLTVRRRARALTVPTSSPPRFDVLSVRAVLVFVCTLS